FRAAFADIEPIGKVHQKDSSKHDNGDTRRSESKQNATHHSQTSSQLCQPDQISHDNWPVMRCSQLLRARASKAPEEDGAPMIEKRHGASYAKKQQRSTDPRGQCIALLHASFDAGERTMDSSPPLQWRSR